ncbi:MAG TPA: GvpL/GvpF family gas vesicle protein [Chloroflexota bacterium]|nr:GvpL/GvpF family gas vesicle protein [Chloroflexota bacterium]
MASDTAVQAAPVAASSAASNGTESESTGVYVYNVIETDEPKTFGNIGIGGRGDEVFTIPYKGLAAVVSRTPLVVYDPTRENALAHEHVNELVIEQGFTPVPMSFGTVFSSEDSVKEFLTDTYDALFDVLKKMQGKLEYGLKVNWNREEVLAEIEKENEELRQLKAEIAGNRLTSTYFARMQLGRLIEQALAEKSQAYIRDIYDNLRDAAIASRSNKPIGDKMIMNAAFLVERDKTAIFDHKLEEIAKKYEGKLIFRQNGPWAPYNFVTIRLTLERAAVV